MDGTTPPNAIRRHVKAAPRNLPNVVGRVSATIDGEPRDRWGLFLLKRGLAEGWNQGRCHDSGLWLQAIDVNDSVLEMMGAGNSQHWSSHLDLASCREMNAAFQVAGKLFSSSVKLT